VGPLLFLQAPWVVIPVLLMFLTKWWMCRFFYKRIGGYTGDCLGCIQQVSEVVYYLGLIGIWKFI
jgi:adenosylcobinamide-GDP ribazoletransferase